MADDITNPLAPALQEIEAESEELGINVSGLVSIIIFYLIVLLIGIWAGWKQRKESQDQETVMLAGRNIGLFVGVLTMGGKLDLLFHANFED